MGGVVSSILGGGGSSESAPTADPRMLAAANSASQIGDTEQSLAGQYLDTVKSQYSELMPLVQSYMQDQSNLATTQQGIASKENALGDQQTQQWQDLLTSAENYNSDSNREQLASQSMADIASAYQSQRQQALDTMARYGVNPNSGRFAALNSQLSNQQAADTAAAATKARQTAEQTGYQRTLDADNSALGTNATNSYGAALAAGNSASAAQSSGISALEGANSTLTSGITGASGIYGAAANAYGTAGDIYGNQYNTEAKTYAADQSAEATAAAGLGNLAGQLGSAYIKATMADGGPARRRAIGHVSGPGGPVDDKIPAMLSNGEYVLPADTTRAIGKSKLDKIVRNTHTPAAVQRRQAISARG